MTDPLIATRIELRQWRQFVTVAEELHFGRAARRLHMTQPPLTMAIRQIESALGTPVFERTSRSVALSPAGSALLPLARSLLADAERMPAVAQAAARGSLGNLRLGFVSTLGYGLLPGWLRSFRDQNPGVEFSLREATFDVQMAAFDAGEIDAGFVSHAPGAEPPGFEVLGVADEPLVLALPAGHALARAADVPLLAALAEPLITFPRAIAPSLYDALLSFYGAHRVAPRIAQQAIQMQTIVNLVSAGMGVAWVPETVMQLQRPGVVYRRVPKGAAGWQSSLVWRAPALPVVQRFVAHVKDHPQADMS
ncbi:LysR substrate-binding domain-containing protein [soil metagenome]